MNKRLALTSVAALTLLTLSLFNQPTQISTQNYIVLTLDTYLSGGEVIAPHLYDWRFDGVDDHIRISRNFNLPASASLRFLAYSLPPSGVFSRLIASGDWTLGGWNIQLSYTGTVNYYHGSYTGWIGAINYFSYTTGAWREIGFASERYGQSLITEGSIIRTGTLDYANFTSQRTHVGAGITSALGAYGYFNGFISYVVIYSIRNSNYIINIHMNKTVGADNLVLFLDATFFNGTHYIDISNSNNHGIPYGGVGRVRSNSTWLWLIRGMYSDNRIRFRFIPRGWYIAVINMDTLWSTVIDTSAFSANPANMVELIEVPIPGAGNYRIVVSEDPIYITLTTTTIVTATVTTTRTVTDVVTDTVTSLSTVTETVTEVAYLTETSTHTVTALLLVPATTVYATTVATHTVFAEPVFERNLVIFLLGVAGLAVPVLLFASRRHELSVLSSAVAMLATLLYASEQSPPGLWRAAVLMAYTSTPACLAVLMTWLALSRSRSPLPAAPAVITGAIHLLAVGLGASVGAVSVAVAAPLALGTAYLMLAYTAISVLKSMRPTQQF